MPTPRRSSGSPKSTRIGNGVRVLGLAMFGLLAQRLGMGGIGPVPLHAQQPLETAGDTLERSLIATLSVDSGRTDSVVIFLTRKVRYGAELQGGGARFSLAPVRHRNRAALLVPLKTPWSGKERFEVYPREDGEHVLRVTAVPGAEASSLALWSDARATRETEAAYQTQQDRTWGIGIMAGLGRYGGYFVESTDTGNPPGGTDVEVGLLLGSGGAFGGAVGFTHQDRGRLGYALNWLFLEPRVRAKSLHLLGGRSTDLGFSLRLAQANASDRTADPSMVAPGVFLTQHLDHGRGARGISTTLAYAYSILGNVDRDTQRSYHRVSLSLGWLP
jgi:hypothetical protein